MKSEKDVLETNILNYYSQTLSWPNVWDPFENYGFERGHSFSSSLFETFVYMKFDNFAFSIYRQIQYAMANGKSFSQKTDP